MKADRDGNKLFDDLEARLATLGPRDTIDVLVRLSRPATADRVQELSRQTGGFAVGRRFGIVDAFSATITKGQAVALSRVPWVVHVEENAEVRASNDSAQSSFGVTKARADAPALDGDGDGAPATYSKDDLVAAVIDTGIDAAHVELDGGKVIGFKDFINGRTSAYDDNGHGTHVAATVAGDGANGGVAPRGALVGVKVLDGRGSGTMEGVTAGIEWVVQNKDVYGIEVVNLSLGAAGCADGTDTTSVAVNNAHAAGLVVAVAAGNEGPGTCTIGSPAAAANALTVGAMSDLGERGFGLASFSSRGPTAEGRVKPDVVAPGVNITSAQSGSGSGYVAYSGTSMAAPFVAGVALLMKDANGALSPQQVKDAIRSTAIDWARGGDNATAGSSGADIDYGVGRLDGYAALKAGGAPLSAPPAMPSHRLDDGSLPGTGAYVDYKLDVTSTTFPVAATMILPAISGAYAWSPDFDLYLYDPAGKLLARAETVYRQEQVAITPSVTGTYTLRVYSYSGSGGFLVDASAPLAAADTTAPAAPSALTATGGDQSVALDWADNTESDLAGYAVYRQKSDGSWAKLASPSTSAYTDSGLAAGTTYAYRVTASDSAGNESAPSAAASATTTADTTAPAAPTGLTASAGDQQVVLDWADNGESDVAGYNVYRQSADGTWAELTSVSASAYTDGGLTNGTTYTYRVTAYDASGNESAASAEASATPNAAAEPIVSTLHPTSIGIYHGSVRSGSVADLAADDGSYLEIKSTTSGTRATDWYGRIVGVSNDAKTLEVTYRGSSSRSCDQTVWVYNWTSGGWTRIDSRSVSSTEVAVVVALDGTLADYVSGTSGDGDVAVRVRCQRNAKDFVTRADLLQVVYTR